MSAVVEVKNLTKEYKQKKAVDDLSFEIRQGEILGLLGPNGSGKSTTINCILSLLKYSAGSIKIFGEEMTPDAYKIKRDIGVIFQEVAVFQELTVYENIDYFCGLYIRDKETRKQYVEDAIAFVELQDYRKFLPKKLSGGLLRRLNIACGIAHKPKLIFFDEPTVAVDPQSRNKILEGIVELNKKGATIIYTSHYMEEVEQICSRILIMDKGQKVALGTKEELKKMIKKTESIFIEAPALTDEQLLDLKQLPHVYDSSYQDGMLKLIYSGGNHNLIRVMEYMKENEVLFGKVYTELPSLNDVFLEITGKTLRD